MGRGETVEVVLVRHGRTDWNVEGRLQGRTDIPLNSGGRLDALRAGRILAREQWHALYTSPLGRAKETADIIGRHVALPVNVYECLIERSFGVLEGDKLGRSSARRRQVPGMEPNLTLRRRALRCLNALADRHRGERLLVVTHGGFINAFLHCISKGRVGTGKTRLANGSLTIVKRVGRQWRIVAINQTSHLNDDEEQP